MMHTLSLFRREVATKSFINKHYKFSEQFSKFWENLNFWDFQNNCRVNSKMQVFVPTYPNHIRFLYCFIHLSTLSSKLHTLKVFLKKRILCTVSGAKLF